jgi:hypothetical protein
MATAAPTPAWRSENALILAALALSLVFLIAFCVVVASVVRSAERQHQAADTFSHPPTTAAQLTASK